MSLPKSGLFAINASLEADFILWVGSELWDFGGVIVSIECEIGENTDLNVGFWNTRRVLEI